MESETEEKPFRPYPRCACGWTGPNQDLDHNTSGWAVCPECGASGGLQWIHDPIPWSLAAYQRANGRSAQDLRWCGYDVPEHVPNVAIFRMGLPEIGDMRMDENDPSRMHVNCSLKACWSWISLHMVIPPEGETDAATQENPGRQAHESESQDTDQ